MDFSLSVERDGEHHNLIAWTKVDRSPAPEQNRGFREMQETIFHGPPAAKEDRNWHLLIDDAPLALNQDRPGVWTWKPGFYAGQVDATLQDSAGTCRGRWRLDVSPDTDKLGRDAFERMLKDICDHDPILALGTEPARRQFGTLGEHQNPVVEFLRLRYHAADIEQSLRALLQEPLRSLRTRRRLSPPHLVRRTDRRTARAALRQPALLVAIGAVLPDDVLKSTEQPLVDAPDVTYHYDNPPNRCLLHALRALQRRCENLCHRLESDADKEKSSDTETGIGGRWPEWKKFLNAFQRKLKSMERQLPFREVTKAEVTVAGLNAVAAHPLCARFWRVSWEALRHGVAGSEPADWLPLNPTWEIYERWCFLKLSEWLKGLLPEDMKWRESAPSGTERQWKGESGESTMVRLHLQRTFGSSENTPQEFWSISRERRPDIVLDWQHGDDAGFLVFDAKYRVTRAGVLNAMESAHIYNDSLRMNQEKPIASVLLTPAPTETSWLETPEFFDEHRSGVLPLHPDRELPPWFNDRVRELLVD